MADEDPPWLFSRLSPELVIKIANFLQWTDERCHLEWSRRMQAGCNPTNDAHLYLLWRVCGRPSTRGRGHTHGLRISQECDRMTTPGVTDLLLPRFSLFRNLKSVSFVELGLCDACVYDGVDQAACCQTLEEFTVTDSPNVYDRPEDIAKWALWLLLNRSAKLKQIYVRCERRQIDNWEWPPYPELIAYPVLRVGLCGEGFAVLQSSANVTRSACELRFTWS
jgi:hypothetical protein